MPQRTVLAVDDDPDLLEVVCGVFSSFRYNVLSARNGYEALSILRREANIDLLFTDIRMPGIDGWEVGRRTILAYPGIKVIYTTGFTDALPKDEQLLHRPLLLKPWQVTDLEELLGRVLGID